MLMGRPYESCRIANLSEYRRILPIYFAPFIENAYLYGQFLQGSLSLVSNHDEAACGISSDKQNLWYGKQDGNVQNTLPAIGLDLTEKATTYCVPTAYESSFSHPIYHVFYDENI